MQDTLEFGDLRELCHRCHPTSFAQIRAWIEESEDQHPGVYRSQWSDYVAQAIKNWPVHYKRAEISHIDTQQELFDAPWTGLVTSVKLDQLDLSDASVISWLIEHLQTIFPSLNQLVVSGPYSRAKELERLSQAGLFQGLTSLYFEGYALHNKAIDVIMNEILANHPSITSLGLVDCAITGTKLTYIHRSPQCAQLEHLNLSKNNHFEQRATRQLATHAANFSNLTHLILEDLQPRLLGMTELLTAHWPAGLQKLVLTPHKLTQSHFKRLETLGKIDMILSDAPGQCLEFAHGFTQGAFNIISRAGFWPNIAHLEFYMDEVTDFSVLSSPDVRLQTLRIQRYPNRGEPPRWETLQGCTRSATLETLHFKGTVPSSEWFFELLKNKGTQLRLISARCALERELVVYWLEHEDLHHIRWPGAYFFIDMGDVDNLALIQNAHRNPDTVSIARAALKDSHPLLWRLWDSPLFNLAKSALSDPSFSIRFVLA